MRGTCVFLSVFSMLCCARAEAGMGRLNDPGKRPSDPQVIIAGGKGSLPVGPAFSFVSPSGTSPISLSGGSPCVVTGLNTILDDCVFQNGTDSNWTSLSFTISPSGQIGPFTCLALAYFNGCFFNNSGTQVTFFGGTGIGSGDDFQIAVVGWLAQTAFSVTATVADSKKKVQADARQATSPAPGSAMALFLGGHIPADWRRVLKTDNFI